MQVPSLQLTWRHGPDMPFKTAGFVQSVIVDGKMYVAGDSESLADNIVMEYDVNSRAWATLPSYRTSWFSMTVVRNQMVLVGGYSISGDSSLLGRWTTDSDYWSYPYPDMPTARCCCSVVGYNQWLVVAGGLVGLHHPISCVEVLSIEERQWYAACPTPRPWRNMKVATIGETAYFTGGDNVKAFKVSLPALIASCSLVHSNKSKGQSAWMELSELPVKSSTPLSIGEFLFVAGGLYNNKEVSTTAIFYYEHAAREWIKVGDLPCACHDCACVTISDSELLVAGGEGQEGRSRRLDYAHISKASLVAFC